MKHTLGIIILLFTVHFSVVVHAATDKAYIEQAREIAGDLNMPFAEKKPLLPQVLEMRQELRNRVFQITRMKSRHAPSCKRARRQLMEVNSLVRKLRTTDD